ncbi:MAG: flavodoxin-dependent (E)-4-hydroxy-3-methylbut-2-enyl-diphosphate synthase [Candidatus Omnitrophica bacterium]|nr:flavodoxin-dependent (E)-4-hydroxy-3-methylbut-2-enyl-diphosphate synthase [Candidatus Omnitrophota bacterium]
MSKIIRRKTPSVSVGHVFLGSDYPVAVQAMTDTPTADVEATIEQTCELVSAGSELVRWTINDDAAALGAIEAINRLRSFGVRVPIVGDFHFNGHLILTKHPQLADLLDKYRINPGNVGGTNKRDDNFASIIRLAIRYKKAVRIGVNGGSLDPQILSQKMDVNIRSGKVQDVQEIMCDAVIESALESCAYALELGLPIEKLVLSAKLSVVQETIEVYERLAKMCEYVFHIGLTEAGAGISGIASSSAALAVLLQQGIGDTIRVSLTPEPGAARSREVEVCREILQSMGFRHFLPRVTSCPGCGRTKSIFFQELARDIKQYILLKMPEWKNKYPCVETLRVAVMGCVVNGPGESRHADIGISLPGSFEDPLAPVYVDGKKVVSLRGEGMKDQFVLILEEYIAKKFK